MPARNSADTTQQGTQQKNSLKRSNQPSQQIIRQTQQGNSMIKGIKHI